MRRGGWEGPGKEGYRRRKRSNETKRGRGGEKKKEGAE